MHQLVHLTSDVRSHHDVVLPVLRCNRPIAAAAADSGKYTEENVATYKAGMSSIDHHMAAQQQQQEDALAALKQQLSADLSAALAAIEQLLPSHKEDMALIEALNR